MILGFTSWWVVASTKSDFCISMSSIDGIASSLSDISLSSKGEVNKSIEALKIKKKNKKGFLLEN
jgi:hypothetical protein